MTSVSEKTRANPDGPTEVASLLVYGSCTAESARRLMPSLEAPILAFAVDCRPQPQLFDKDVDFRTYESYLGDADYESIDRFVLDFMKHGFEIKGQDLTEWDGVSLSGALVAEVSLSLPGIVKSAVCARRVMEHEKPRYLYLGDGLGLHREIWRLEAERAGVACTELELELPPEIQKEWMPTRSSRDAETLTKVRSFLQSTLSTLVWLGKETTAWLRGYSSRPCVVLASRLDRDLASSLSRSERIRVKTLDACSPIMLQSLIARRVNRGAKAVFAERWRCMMDAGPDAPRFHYEGISLWEHLSGWAESVFKISLPAHAVTLALAREHMNRAKPALLLSAPNNHPSEVLSELLATRQGAMTISYQQEWTMGSRRRYLPQVTADYLMCWGEFSARYFERQGFPGKRACRVGRSDSDNLMDRVIGVDVEKAYEELGIKADQKVVLFTDQYFQQFESSISPSDFVEIHLDSIINTARELSGVNFLVKFHPKTGMNEWHERADSIQRRVNRINDGGLPNVSLVPLHSDIAKALAIADVVVTYCSTTAIDAMLVGKPLLLIDFTGKASQWPDLNTADAPVAIFEEGELKATLSGLLNDESVLLEALVCQKKYLERVLSPRRDVAKIIEALALAHTEALRS